MEGVLEEHYLASLPTLIKIKMLPEAHFTS